MNHYETLGVTKDADDATLKKAYRKLASINHPDKGGDTSKFQEIQVAYETLSDSNKRAEYDQILAGGGRREFRFRGSNSRDFNASNMFGDDGMADIFEHLHRQFGGGFRRQPQSPTNRDVRIAMQMKLVDTLEEQEKVIKVSLPGNQDEEIKVKIPRGVYHGSQIRYPGLGDSSVKDAPRGDLYIQFLLEPVEGFEQVGIDLITAIPVSCLDAIVGCEKEVTGIDGKKFNVTIPPGSQYGSKFGIKSQGLYSPDSPGRGRLVVVLDVFIPTDLTAEQLSVIKSMQQPAASATI